MICCPWNRLPRLFLSSGLLAPKGASGLLGLNRMGDLQVSDKVIAAARADPNQLTLDDFIKTEGSNDNAGSTRPDASGSTSDRNGLPCDPPDLQSLRG